MSKSPDNWFQKLRRHPVFPAFVFIVFASIVKENYPFSHYAMYSNPRNRPLHFAWLADESGDPLPILWHTGLSTSKMSKILNHNRGNLEDAARKKKKDLEDPGVIDEINREAGEIVLRYMRDQSMKRQRRELVAPLKLYESAITVEGKELVERDKLIAELPAAANPGEPTE